MRVSTLKSPGRLTNAIRLRQEVCNAISAVEVRGAHGNADPSQSDLVGFLQDAEFRASQARRTAAPVPKATPFSYQGAAKGVIVEFPVALNPRLVPAAAQFVIAGKTIQGGVVSGNRLILCVNSNVAAGFTVAYTDLGSGDRLQDLSGNFVASFSLTGGVLRTTLD
jgi:hypothetical protein